MAGWFRLLSASKYERLKMPPAYRSARARGEGKRQENGEAANETFDQYNDKMQNEVKQFLPEAFSSYHSSDADWVSPL